MKLYERTNPQKIGILGDVIWSSGLRILRIPGIPIVIGAQGFLVFFIQELPLPSRIIRHRVYSTLWI